MFAFIHSMTDGECRPIAFVLTSGRVADCTAGGILLEQVPKSPILHGDKGYDSNAIERVFGRFKDFRRIAARYDRSATNFLAAVCLVATVSYWLLLVMSPDSGLL